jgi:solute:Na+ symporter, SSS family
VPTVQLQTIDVVIVAAYLLGVTALGLYVSRGVKTSTDFFLAGRSLPWWVAGMSLVVSDIGAKDMVGLAGDAYRYGIVMMNFDFVGCTFAVLIAAFLFMPLFWDAGITTIPEYLGRRYNMAVRTFFAVVWSLFMVGTVATILVSAASMFEGLLGWSFWFSVGLTTVLVGIFTTSGGLKAVAVTDAVSCVVLIAGAALLCGIGLWHVGGPAALIDRVSALPWTAEHFELLPSASHEAYPWPAVILGLGLVLGPAYWVGNQAIVQRTLGTSSEADARASYVFAAVIKLVFPLLLVLPGLLAIALFSERLGPPGAGWDGNRVLPLMIAELVPTGALGLLIGAFVAAVMANLDSYINSASTLLVTDLYRPYLRPGASDEECLKTGRLLVIVLLVLGALVSYQVKVRFGSVFEAFQTFLSFFQGALFSLLIFGLLTRAAWPAPWSAWPPPPS